MEKLDKIFKMIMSLKNISSDIIRKTIPHMKSIELENNIYVKEVKKKFPNISEDEILEKMQKVTLDWIKDAEKVRAEVNIFIKEEDNIFKLNFDECKFLEEVWNGDTYDKMDLEGLQSLLEDLKMQSSTISQENLITQTINYIRAGI